MSNEIKALLLSIVLLLLSFLIPYDIRILIGAFCLGWCIIDISKFLVLKLTGEKNESN